MAVATIAASRPVPAPVPVPVPAALQKSRTGGGGGDLSRPTADRRRRAARGREVMAAVARIELISHGAARRTVAADRAEVVTGGRRGLDSGRTRQGRGGGDA